MTQTLVILTEANYDRNAYLDIIDNKVRFDCSDEEYERILGSIVPLEILIKKYQPQLVKEDKFFMKEFILWGLVEYKKLSKDRFSEGYQFKDIYGSFISKL